MWRRALDLLSIQLGGALSKIGKKFEVAVGVIGDEEIYKEIEDYARVAVTVSELRKLNIGVVGRPFRGMFDLEWDKTKIKGILGPNIHQIELKELLDVFNEVTDDEIRELVEETKKRFIIDIPDEDVAKTCKLAIALQKLVKKFNIDALCHLCQWHLHIATNTTPCYGSSLLNEQGVMVSCEGDVGTLIVMCILQMLTGKPAAFGEWALFDEEKNAIIIMHHGYGNPQLAKDRKKVSIRSHVENWGYEGCGAGLEFIGKPGRVTMAALIDDAKGVRMLITGGEALDIPALPLHTAHWVVKMDRPVKEFLKDLIKGGIAHHTALVYGDYRKHLEKVAELLGIRKWIL